MDEYQVTQQGPQEIVLTYSPHPVPPAPEEIVLRREAPLPGAPEAETPPPPAPAEPSAPARPGPVRRRRPRHGLLIFTLCLAALLLTSSCLLVYVLRRERGRQEMENWEDKFHQYWDGYEAQGEGDTSIPAYPVGGDFRLRLTEERETALTAGEVYQRVNPSVVTVLSHLPSGGAGVGTGIIMSEDGYLVTNFHVVEGGESCDVLFSSGYGCEARLVGYDEENDLAVLKVDEEGLSPASFGTSDLLSVGDKAYAIGNPLGLKLRGTLTDGLISAIDRDVDVDGVTMTLIQTNAALNSGNSGGPLINEYGQVVGINTVKMVAHYDDDGSIEGLGFAIPSTTVAHIANCLIATGEVTPEPVLGITVQGQAELADGTVGIVVIEVTEGLGGGLAGVRPGDVITAVDGESITDSSQIILRRRRYAAGEDLPMTIFRDGQYLEVQVPLMLPEE